MQNGAIADHSPSLIRFDVELEALRVAPDANSAKGASDSLARAVKKAGPGSLLDGGVLATLQTFATNKKSNFEKESAPVGYQSLATVLGPSALPLLLPCLPTIVELISDKGDVIRSAASAALRSIIALTPACGIEPVIQILLEHLASTSKWRGKVAVLREIGRLTTLHGDVSKEAVAGMLTNLLPSIEVALHDTKTEVSNAASKCADVIYQTLPNPDLRPHIPALISAVKTPTTVPETIKGLSNTTFVSEVTEPSLAVLTPLLGRGLADRGMDTQRRTVVVVENVCKLVRDPDVAARYLSTLVDGVEKIAVGASFPEVREFASSALKVLLGSGARKDAAKVSASTRDLNQEVGIVQSKMTSYLPGYLFVPSPNTPDLSLPAHPLFKAAITFSARLVADLIQQKNFTEVKSWAAAIGVYIQPWLRVDLAQQEAEAKKTAEDIRINLFEAEKATWPKASDVDNSAVLTDTLFSLAYGALLLLSHTRLTLLKGHRYGICAGNGSGKSTLLKAIRDGKVEGFPSQDEVRAVMVEHALQGEDGSLTIIDFIAADKQLAGISRETIAAQLREVGFDDARQQHTVGSLSGGWKMKLELGRAMLYKADLLLLDEPTNHLDVASVKWLEDYLVSHDKVTCLIVSHDSGFLDHVTTDIIHYESKKLVYYPGNLSNFVAHVPAAKSYYTLSATSVKFSFPPPGSLMGVRSNTRAIMKVSGCTFTYPGRKDPSLIDVTAALSLSSRIGVVGPNGAGKSTLIKLLTGETVPQIGTVYKHPSLRVGYVSQHATHHIEKHLEKTAVAYIQWRFQDGHDRETLEKATRVISDEDKAMMDQEFVGKNGEKRKVEMIMGRQKHKKSLQYEIKWRGLDHKFNSWLPREELLERGFGKLVGQFDDLESSREGAGSRETSANAVKKVLEEVGLDGNIAMYNEMGGLSGGQKVKVVIAASLWSNPQVLVLDEPTNFLDREALGGLAVAIREWAGAVLIISHNSEFVDALCPEIWNVDGGRLTQQGKVAIIEDNFADSSTTTSGSGMNSKFSSAKNSALPTPATSVGPTPNASGDERTPGSGVGSPATLAKKKKKLTRNQIKLRDERRKARKLAWLSFGGPKPEDTDSD